VKTPFAKIKRNYRAFQLKYVSRAFATSSTLRMLRKWKHDDIRELMRTSLGNCRVLYRSNSQPRFDRDLKSLIDSVRKKSRHFKRKQHRKICFGHAAKLVNLYIKALVSRRDVLNPRNANHIAKYAHVPLDRIVLKRVLQDFPELDSKKAIKRNMAIKDLDEEHYTVIQEKIRVSAHKVGMKPLDYDLWWAVRPKTQ